MIKPLSDEAIMKAREQSGYRPSYKKPMAHELAIAQEAQRDTLRQVVDWGEEICKEHKLRIRQRIGIEIKRGLCSECWQELKKQVED